MYRQGIEIVDAPTWASSLEMLPDKIDGHALTCEVMTTMVMDLDYLYLDKEMPNDLDIHLVISPAEKKIGLALGVQQ